MLYGIVKVPDADVTTLVAVPPEIADAIISTSGKVSELP